MFLNAYEPMSMLLSVFKGRVLKPIKVLYFSQIFRFNVLYRFSLEATEVGCILIKVINKQSD